MVDNSSTQFDRSHRSIVGSSSGILVVHALSLSLLLSFSSSISVQPEDHSSFQRWAGLIHKCCTVTTAAATGMAVSTVSEVPISEVTQVSAASDAVTVSSSMLTSTVTTSSGLRPIPASCPGGLANLLASLVRTAVCSELSGAAGQHCLSSGPPATVSLPSSSVVPMVPVVLPTPVGSSSSGIAAAGILPGMFLPVYLHDLLGGAFWHCLDCMSQPSCMVYHRHSFGVSPASFSFSFFLSPPSSYPLPLYLYFFWNLPQTFALGLLVCIPINPPWYVHSRYCIER